MKDDVPVKNVKIEKENLNDFQYMERIVCPYCKTFKKPKKTLGVDFCTKCHRKF